jgi:hypothetical protein
MQELKIVYIDDQLDYSLERYLDEEYSNAEYSIVYSEVLFNPEYGYESLIRLPDIKSANIIFIDSRLFENGRVTAGKFSGEEFKIILKKYYPFIEVIVITQNEPDPELGTISKYNPNCGKSAFEYYNDILPHYISEAIRNLKIYRKIAEKLHSNENWESVLKEKILNSLNGVETYDELTKTDIDNLINMFKDIQGKING